LTAALGLVLASGVARAADPPAAPTLADILYARSVALAAYRGVAPGADAIFFNPGALAARRRYTLEFHYLVERAGADNQARFFGAAAVDSETGPVTAGVAYTRVLDIGSTGSVFDLALAGPLGKGLHLGVSGEYVNLGGADRVNAVTANAGIYWEASPMISVGVAGYNLLPIGHALLAPPGLGVGLSVGSDRSFHVAADWRGLFDSQGKVLNAYSAGAEVLVADMFPLRAGYLRDEWRRGQWWSAGVGVVTASGVAVDFSYRQAIGAPGYRTLSAGLKLFLTTP
jgi:hypothetical protein